MYDTRPEYVVEMRDHANATQIMRLDFVQRQRQWEAELARQAPSLPAERVEDAEDEDESELPTLSDAMQMSSSAPMPDEEVDQLLQRENEELEALLAYMPNHERVQEAAYNNDARSEHFWSDDDDYDALFSEITDPSDNTGQRQTGEAQSHIDDDDAMDLS